MAKKKAKKGGKKKKKKKASSRKKRKLRLAGKKKAAGKKKSAKKKKKAGKKKKARQAATPASPADTTSAQETPPRGNDGTRYTAVDRCDSRRENRAESSGRVAVSHRLPAVTGETEGKRGGGEGPRRPEAQRTGLVIRPKNGDLGRSARLPQDDPRGGLSYRGRAPHPI